MVDEKIIIDKLEMLIENFKEAGETNKKQRCIKILDFSKGVPYLLTKLIEFINDLPKEVNRKTLDK